VDTTLILAGPQGYYKSTFFRVLAGDHAFCDTPIDMRNKDAYLALRGAWLYEMAELSSMRPRDAETVKAFLAAQEDHYRPPYGREMVDAPRQVVFVGTTNEVGFLNDPTGARRFWPVAVTRPIRVQDVRAERDQLWAEAVAAFRQGESWWLGEEGDAELREVHQDYESEDPWEVMIREWIEGLAPTIDVTIAGILTVALKIEPGQQNRAHEMRCSGLLTRMGFKRRRIRIEGKRTWIYDRPDSRQQGLL
jgi:putative DNA primase/helicase